MRFNFIFFSFLFFLMSFSFTKAQSDSIQTTRYTAHNKGKMYFYYGGNREYYTDSDLRIRNNNYDFVLHDISAHDRPSKGVRDYFNPLTLTTPQTNYRIGYYFHDKYNISLGLDHMKYVMDQHQMVDISGNYPNGYAIADGKIDLSDGKFLQYEHTDGLNYINFEINRVEDISKFLKIKNTDKIQVNVMGGLGSGILFPRTDARFLDKPRWDQFHISGFGVHLNTALNITFFKHYFIQTEFKGGYINMNDIRISDDPSDKASQDFFFLQNTFVVGTIWQIF
jgi:hypothetical protein